MYFPYILIYIQPVVFVELLQFKCDYQAVSQFLLWDKSIKSWLIQISESVGKHFFISFGMKFIMKQIQSQILRKHVCK